MTSPSTEARYRELVAVSAVGGLDPADAGLLRVHLTGCPACRRELAEARRVAALLERVPPEAFIDEPASPDDLVLHRALRRIGAEASIRSSTGSGARPELGGREVARPEGQADGEGRRIIPQPGQHARRPERPRGQGSRHGDRPTGRPAKSRGNRWRSGLGFAPAKGSRARVAVGALALALGLLGTGGVIGWSAGSAGDRDSPVSTRPAAATAQAEADPTKAAPAGVRLIVGHDAKTGVTLRVEITPQVGWVQLDTVVTGAPAGVRCRLVATSRLGDQEQAASWLEPADPAAEGTSITGSAWVGTADLGAVSVITEDGQKLVTAVA